MKIIGFAFLFSAALAFAGQNSGDSVAVGCASGAKIESIDLDGLKYTKPHVVWRELSHKVGGVFSQETFEAEKLRLQDLDLFTEITVTCETSASGDSLSSLVSRLSSKLTYHFKEIFRWIP